MRKSKAVAWAICDEAGAEELYLISKLSYREIGEKLNITKNQARYYLSCKGVPVASWNKGWWDTHPVPPEMIEKIRQAALADSKNRSIRMSGDNNPMFGKCGKLSPNWRGGYEGAYPVEYRAIRDYILERDNYTCQLCFQPAMLVHHKDWDTWNNSEDNLVAFCKPCNALPREEQIIKGRK